MEEDFKTSSNNNRSNRYGINDDSDNDEDQNGDCEAFSALPDNNSAAQEYETATVLSFCGLIVNHAVQELRIPEEDREEKSHERQYGACRKPFGLLRMRVVEFLHEAFRVFFRKEVHSIFLESDLYNTLLFFFDHYPFHNILHQKVCDIFIYLLDKS